MKSFKYSSATDAASAVRTVSANQSAKFLAGGTNLIDLMKEYVERPSELVDIYAFGSAADPATSNGISIGALAKNTDTANHPLVRQNYPLLSMAILAGARDKFATWRRTAGT